MQTTFAGNAEGRRCLQRFREHRHLLDRLFVGNAAQRFSLRHGWLYASVWNVPSGSVLPEALGMFSFSDSWRDHERDLTVLGLPGMGPYGIGPVCPSWGVGHDKAAYIWWTP